MSDVDSQRMGKARSNALNSHSYKESAENSMAPQKIWSMNTLPSFGFESVADVDELLQGLARNVFDIEIEKMIDGNVKKDIPGKDTCNEVSESNILSADYKSSRIKGVDFNEKHSLLKKELSNFAEKRAIFGDVKLWNGEVTCRFKNDSFTLDHPYALSLDTSHVSTLQEGVDDTFSNNCKFARETEKNKLSVTRDNHKFALDEQMLNSCMEFNKNYVGFKPLSPASSTSSLTVDLASSSSYSILSGDEYDDTLTGVGSPESTDPSFPNSCELENLVSCRLNNKLPNMAATNLNSDSLIQNIYPLFNSSSIDWSPTEIQQENSETIDSLAVFPDDTTKVAAWLNSVYHDHDYCSKDSKVFACGCGSEKCMSHSVHGDAGTFSSGKRKYTKKNRIDGLREKILKAKYLKKELLRKDSFLKPVLDSKPTLTNFTVQKPNTQSVGLRKRKIDRSEDEKIDPETERKLKITGKFQDQYVYYLSKSSRTTSRGRLSTSVTSGKSHEPAANPGDIVIPHLTDSDIEAVRLKGRAALQPRVGPQSTSISTHSLPFQSDPSFSDHSTEHMFDVDSHIVSTILSMENDCVYSASPQVPDVICASSLDSDQPTLTESLRQLSGDPADTPEHVLGYLLSLVKDGEYTDSEYGSETSASVLCPPMSSDNTFVDHADKSEVFSDVTTNIQGVIPGEELIPINSVQRMSSDDSVLHSGSQNDHTRFHTQSDCIADAALFHELSAFMLGSKEALFSSVNPNEDSNSLVLKALRPDPSSNEFPQTPSMVHRLTSIEKTIDYLVRNDNVFDHSSTESNLETTGFADDTPWIVTVTLYFNDVPAIMINNQPYIRLVDIHKQILPAKDTGILKKRCQLLKIPVLNCTEMQRHFLVQYAKACNSKSTIIVSNKHAADLIAYYAAPQTRAGRLSHGSHLQLHKNLQGEKIIAPYLPPRINRHQQSRKVSRSLGLPKSSDLHKPSTFKNMLPSETSSTRKQRRKKVDSADLKTFEPVIHNPSKKTQLKHCSDVTGKKHSYVHKRKNRKVRHRFIHKVNSKFNKQGSLDKKAVKNQDDSGCFVSPDMSQAKVKNSLNRCRKEKRSLYNEKSSSGNSTSSTSVDGSLRILHVRHQAALSTSSLESQLPPQPADLYLDLFVRPDSACVLCATCSQYFSVSHFMGHHHVPSDCELLAAQVALRILVPQNEKMSKLERHLWREFCHQQKAFGSFKTPQDETDNENDDIQNMLTLPKSSSSLTSRTSGSLQYTHKKVNKETFSAPNNMKNNVDHDSLVSHQPLSSYTTPRIRKQKSSLHAQAAMPDTSPTSQSITESTAKVSTLRAGMRIEDSNLHATRTSTRKRKSKVFFY